MVSFIPFSLCLCCSVRYERERSRYFLEMEGFHSEAGLLLMRMKRLEKFVLGAPSASAEGEGSPASY